MNTYKVTYSGVSLKFKNLELTINAESERGAVETIFKQVMGHNYFPQEDGSILDCDGDEIASATDTVIEHDGGYFTAELLDDENDTNEIVTQEFSIHKLHEEFNSRNEIIFTGTEQECKDKLQYYLSANYRIGANIVSEDDYQFTCDDYGDNGETVQFIIK